ncbi:MAG: hypothetical protein ABJI96_08940 [Paracoccaceae bacterium]
MSLIQLGSAATRRQFSQGEKRQREGEVALAGVSELTRGGVTMATAAIRNETDTETEKALEQLIRYLPTETVTLFLAAVSFANAFDHVSWIAALMPFGLIALFTLITPLILLAAAFATFVEAQRKGTIPADTAFSIPVFDMIASAIAFVPWALAVPGLFLEGVGDVEETRELTAELAQVAAAFLAFVTSWALSLVRRIIGPGA